MQALCRTKSGELKLMQVEQPQIVRPEDVKIRVRYCTICNDELRMATAGDFFSREGIVGHEMTGEIVELGAMARYSDFRVGDRVGVDPAVSCGVCRACLRGHGNHCCNLNFINGCVCEYVVRSYRQLVKLPDHITDAEGCFLEPIGAVLQAMEAAHITFEASLAIFGSGFAGLMFAQIAAMRGAKCITVIEPMQTRRALAMQRGAAYVFDDLGDELYEKTGVLTDFNGYDVVVETSARLETVDTCVRVVARGGTLLLYTYYGVQQMLSLNTMSMYLENLNVRFSFSSCGKFPEVLHLLPALQTGQLIGAEFPLAGAEKAYQLQKTRQHIKIGIRI